MTSSLLLILNWLILLSVSFSADALSNGKISLVRTIRSDSKAHRRTETLDSYNVPAFALLFTLPKDNTRSWDQISAEVIAVVEAYLKQYFLYSTLRTETTLQDLRNVDLSGPIKETATALSTDLQYIIQLYGTIEFTDTPYRPTETEAQALIGKLLFQALQSDFTMFKAAMESAFPTLGSLTVNTEPVDLFPAASSPQSTDRWSDVEIVFTSFLVFSFLFSITLISIFVRLEYRHKSYSRPGNIYDDDGRDAYIGRHINDQDFQQNGDPAQNGSGGDPGVVPVALFDELPSSRRYIATSNPFELLYGASFLHSESPRVEKKKSKKKRSHTSSIRPMLSITEEEIESNSMHSNSSWEGGVAAFLFRNLPSSLSWTATKPPEAVKDPELPFAFRDFPRHDGTPCLMYRPKEKGEVEMGAAPLGAVVDNRTDMSLIIEFINAESQHSLNSFHSLSNSRHSLQSSGSVDNFVDKLEALMLLKHKQYEERTKMDLERQEKKRERDANRASGRTPPPQCLPDLLDDVVTENVFAPVSPAQSDVTPEKFISMPNVGVSPADVTKLNEPSGEGVFA